MIGINTPIDTNNSGSDDDPYTETTPENTLKYLSASK